MNEIVKGSIDLIRQLNYGLVYASLEEHKELSRTDLSRLTGLSPASITKITRELLDGGLVVTCGESSVGRGRRQTLLRINERRFQFLSMRLGRGYVDMALFDLAGHSLARHRHLFSESEREDLLASLVRLRDALLDVASGDGDLTHQLSVDKQDEIGQTAEAFNRFIGSLRQMFLEVREHSVSLNGGIDALNGITRQLASDSQQQADASSATAATIEQITVSINHIASNATSAEEVVVQTGQTSRQSAQAVGELAGGIERIVDIKLNEDEQVMFDKSVDAVKGLVAACKAIDPSLA